LGGGQGNVAERVLFTWHDTVVVEQDSTDGEALTWHYRGLRPLAQIERRVDRPGQAENDRRFYAIVTDLVGTPTHLVDETGEIAVRYSSTHWGVGTSPGGSARTPLRFPGQYADEETGWHYNYHRHYDPETSRYTSADPLGLIPSPNVYAYVRNPNNWADPLGLSPCSGAAGANPAAPMDSFLANGSTVRHSSTATAIGDDANTIQNFMRSQGARGHDVIVHGDEMGNFRVDGLAVHPQQIADAILENPGYTGGPIQLVSCHSANGAARELGEILGVHVNVTSPHTVDLDPATGLLRDFPEGPMGNPRVIG
jgi:RHS repeat-associated protein